LYSPGGSVKCLQMPGGSFYDRTVLWRVRKGVRGCQRGGLFAVARQLGAGSLFSIVRQSGASSSSPGGSVKVFTDARGGLFNRIAVRCQLLFLWRVREGIRRCQRGVGGTISN
jgi:hypothetical protein